MRTKHVNFGTRLRCEVLDSKQYRGKSLLVLKGEDGEAYILVGDDSSPPPEPKTCIIEFTQGSPMGGYWHVIQWNP